MNEAYKNALLSYILAYMPAELFKTGISDVLNTVLCLWDCVLRILSTLLSRVNASEFLPAEVGHNTITVNQRTAFVFHFLFK